MYCPGITTPLFNFKPALGLKHLYPQSCVFMCVIRRDIKGKLFCMYMHLKFVYVLLVSVVEFTYVYNKKQKTLSIHVSCHLCIAWHPRKCLLTNLTVDLYTWFHFVAQVHTYTTTFIYVIVTCGTKFQILSREIIHVQVKCAYIPFSLLRTCRGHSSLGTMDQCGL